MRTLEWEGELQNMLKEIADTIDANDQLTLVLDIGMINRKLLEQKCDRELALKLNETYIAIVDTYMTLAKHSDKIHDWCKKLESREELIS